MAIQHWKHGQLTLADLFEPLDRPGVPGAATAAPVGRRVVLYAEAPLANRAQPIALRLHVDLSELGAEDEVTPETRLAFTAGGVLVPIARRRFTLRGPATAGAPAGAVLDRVTSVFGVEIALIGVASLGMEYRLTERMAQRAGQRSPSGAGIPDPTRQRIRWFLTREDA